MEVRDRHPHADAMLLPAIPLLGMGSCLAAVHHLPVGLVKTAADSFSIHRQLARCGLAGMAPLYGSDVTRLCRAGAYSSSKTPWAMRSARRIPPRARAT